jgi:predicted esterase
MLHEHHLTVPRTARYLTVGEPGPAVRDVWIVCHGYGQLAADFAKRFAVIAAPHRLIVAPEALSRFYHDHPTGGPHQNSPVGATWMTREDRSAEIADQVTYLERLVEEIQGRVSPPLSLTLLGFSQGVATLCRWLAHSSVRPRRVICWGAPIPEDVHIGELASFRGAEIVLVSGLRDTMVQAGRIQADHARLTTLGLHVDLLTFAGGHRLDDDTLRRLAEK